MSKSGVLLASGGMDSTTLAFWLDKQGIDFVPLFINYGQHCSTTELETLKSVLPQHYREKIEIIDISSVYRRSKSRFILPANLWEEEITADDLYIPYRNTLLLSIGATYAMTLGLSSVYSAFINSNHAKEIDCSSDFFNKMEDLLSDYGAVKINMPFRDYSKYEVAKLGIQLGANIGLTFSCQASPTIPCGACPNCVDRLTALRQLEHENNLS